MTPGQQRNRKRPLTTEARLENGSPSRRTRRYTVATVTNVSRSQVESGSGVVWPVGVLRFLPGAEDHHVVQEDATKLRKLAEDCRALALIAKVPEIRTELVTMAEQFERLAQVRQANDQAPCRDDVSTGRQ